MLYIIGLGNPGEEYENTRHNTGRMALEYLLKDLKKEKLEDLKLDKKSNALISDVKIGKEKALLVFPETFMNKSGKAVSAFIKPKTGKNKAQENLIVIHDDIDLPIGNIKISYNKGVGGHRGLDSVVKAVKTLEFVRIRVGVSPATSKGKVKKPGADLSPAKAGEAVIDFILGKFKPKELEILKKEFKTITEAIKTIAVESREKAMSIYNKSNY